MPTEDERQPAALGADARYRLDRDVRRTLRLAEVRDGARELAHGREHVVVERRGGEPLSRAPAAPAARRRAARSSRAAPRRRARARPRRSPRRAAAPSSSPAPLTGRAARPAGRGSTTRRRPSAARAGSRCRRRRPPRAPRSGPRPARSITEGAPMLGSTARIGRQRRRGRVHHQVAAPARRDDAGEHQLEPLDELALCLERGVAATSTACDSSSVPTQPQPVRARSRARRDEVDDRVREPEARRGLDRAGHGHELRLDAEPLEARSRRDGVRGRDAEPVERRQLLLRRVLRHRRLQRAAREARAPRASRRPSPSRRRGSRR